jgi:hypothetical protein
MKAVEVTGKIDEEGNLSLDEPLPRAAQTRVRVIVLFPESSEGAENDPDDTPVESVKASLRRALQQAKAGSGYRFLNCGTVLMQIN